MQKKDFFSMWFYRLVSGDLMDRTALSCHRTFYYDGQNLSSDVPYLRTCSTDPSGLLQACPLSGYGTGDHLQLRDFFRGIFKRIIFFRSFTSVPGIILMFRFSIKE